jgi:HEAT repeat protein
MKIQSSRAATVGILVLVLAVPAVAQPQSASERIAKLREQSAARNRVHIDEYMKQLAHDKDPEVRARAADGLGSLKATNAIPLLTTALGDAAPAVRASAAGALGRLAPDSASAVPALGEALKDPAAEVRVNAAFALWKLAPASRVAVPALEKALGDASPKVRLEAAGALNALDAGTPARLVSVLGGLLNDANLAKEAAEVLVNMDLENADVRRVVLEGLAHGEVNARRAIVDGMAKAELNREAALPYVPALAQAIRADKEVQVRMGAMWAAQTILPLPEELAAALEGALKDESPDVRQAAAQVLNQAGGDAQRRKIEEIVAGARGSGGVDMKAIEQAAARAPGGTVDRLIGELRTGATEQARSAAAKAVSQMSSSADPAAEALSQALLSEPSGKVRVSIAEALHTVTVRRAEATVIAALVQALEKDREPAVREEAARALADQARRSPEAARPALKAALRDPDSGVRAAAQEALDTLGKR